MNEGPETRKQLVSFNAWVTRTVLKGWSDTSSTKNLLEMQISGNGSQKSVF